MMIREGKFDVVIAAGPRVDPWPSVGVRALSTVCADFGLSVGIFGGASVAVKGVIPLPGAGAWVLAQDVQSRIHRIHARSVVRISAADQLAPPFPGGYSSGLVPLSTARRLWKANSVRWDPSVVILGTGNSALQFGSELLDSGVGEVVCVEPDPQRGAKRFSGWEVERRRFEMAGGKLIEAIPIQLKEKSALVWELRLQDSRGVRVHEVARVVSAGPFGNIPAVREYPAGSLLFELEQSAAETKEQDVDGWMLEEERGRLLGCKIARALATDMPGMRVAREDLDKTLRRTRSRLKRYTRHILEPFTPGYQGKWLSLADLRRIKEFPGVPAKEHFARMVASVECLESISCDICHRVCPEGAIALDRTLDEKKCSGCGACVEVCPASAIVLIRQREDHSSSFLAMPWRGLREWKNGDLPTVVNRRGEVLGSARVVNQARIQGLQDLPMPEPSGGAGMVYLELPSHLLWEARMIKRPKSAAADDERYLASVSESGRQEGKIEVTINGEKRRVRDQVPISTALFELGLARFVDVLHCSDGSCGLCSVSADGVKKLACQTPVHKGMAVQLPGRRSEAGPEADTSEGHLCSCQGISENAVLARMQQGDLRSPEAVLAATQVGEGQCRGQRCMDPFKRLLSQQGMDLSQWVDWRFPWTEWTLTRS